MKEPRSRPPTRRSAKKLVFISWSGVESESAALMIKKLLSVLTGVDVWVSSVSIDAGQDWSDELNEKLQSATLGVLCLTPSALSSAWLHFESGALSARAPTVGVVPVPIGITQKELQGLPVERFQSVTFDRDGLQRLVQRANDAQAANHRFDAKTLDAVFTAMWKTVEQAHGAVLERVRRPPAQYDVFLSVPMASFTDDAEYQAFRADVEPVVSALRTTLGLKVFWAMDDIKTMADFDLHDLGAREDVEALENSRHFMLIWPSKLASSALFEAGYALALGMPMLMFVKKQTDLPYLMSKLPQSFDRVSVYDDANWRTYKDLAALLTRNPELFA